MTSVAFHFNVSDRNDYLGRLVRKGASSGAKLLLLVPEAELTRLDSALWQWAPTEFLVHCLADAPKHTVARSRVLLTSRLNRPSACDVLINLCEQVPDGFADFQKVIEVVGLDENDRQSARQRWRRYAQAGAELVRHDALARETT